MPTIVRRRWVMRGHVQGVGYRPFLYRLARTHRVNGFVRNTVGGVQLEAEGPGDRLRAFELALRESGPPLARVEEIASEDVEPTFNDPGFRILSHGGVECDDASATDRHSIVEAPLDTAVCLDCLREIRSTTDRRRNYPLTNCTNCGPRFTILRRLPYDRCNTAMAAFEMCANCGSEYRDPADRRFHAQPVSCHDCGPQVALVTPDGRSAEGDPIAGAARLLLQGRIIAVKGLGGFHLAVRADEGRGVARLRWLKHRESKPLALMCRSPAGARRLVKLSSVGLAALESVAAPIVLAPRIEPSHHVAANVAPGTHRLGVMLPYTPLHHLMFDALGDAVPALVMTSGNESSEPLVIDNNDALARLGGMCDAILWHDRPIVRGLDDSVLIDCGDDQGVIPVRRARGYVPSPIRLHEHNGAAGVAVGGEMKSTIAVVREDGAAVLSGHLGDLIHPAPYRGFGAAVNDLISLYQVRPAWIAHDLHPSYLSTGHAKRMAAALHVPAVAVQHHHAHAAAVLAEHGHVGPALAVVCDGTGYGTDGTIWGGELLHVDLASCRRLARLRPLLLPGGDAAALDPKRSAVALLHQALGLGFHEHPAAVRMLGRRSGRSILVQMMRAGAGCVASSSSGRVFDAISALLGICTQNTFEAQAAMALESAAAGARSSSAARTQRFALRRGGVVEVDFSTFVRELLERQMRGEPAGELAADFHEQFALAWRDLVADAVQRTGITTVALSGGVFCNVILLRRLTLILRARRLTVLTHKLVPPNDGGLSLGQAAVAAARAARRALAS